VQEGRDCNEERLYHQQALVCEPYGHEGQKKKLGQTNWKGVKQKEMGHGGQGEEQKGVTRGVGRQ